MPITVMPCLLLHHKSDIVILILDTMLPVTFLQIIVTNEAKAESTYVHFQAIREEWCFV